MTAKHSASPTSYHAFFHGLGQIQRLPSRKLNAGYRFGKGTFAEAHGNGQVAPIPAVQPRWIELVKSTLSRPS
jgi:hypothetical protein